MGTNSIDTVNWVWRLDGHLPWSAIYVLIQDKPCIFKTFSRCKLVHLPREMTWHWMNWLRKLPKTHLHTGWYCGVLVTFLFSSLCRNVLLTGLHELSGYHLSRKTLIPNRGRRDSLSLFRQARLGEGKLWFQTSLRAAADDLASLGGGFAIIIDSTANWHEDGMRNISST